MDRLLVLVRDERIATVSAKPIPASSQTERIDGRGGFLTPGLMDSHVHVSDAPGLPASHDPAITALREASIRQQPRNYLYFGVTQLLDLAGLPAGIAAVEAQPQRPDLFRCGAAIVVLLDKEARQQVLPAVVFEPANAAQHPLPPGEDPARHTPEFIVDQIAASGARCVKIFIEDGCGERSGWR
jgi:hypothetical protein